MADANRPREKAEQYVWDVGSLTWVPMTQASEAQSSATATRTQVNDTAVETQLLASSATRKGATILNDSSAALLLGLGTASVTTTDYSVRLIQYAYYEVPYGYTGQVRGIWESDPGTGGARITSLS